LRDGGRKHEFEVGMWPIQGLAFSRDARVLYVGGSPDMGPGQVSARHGVVRAWDRSTGAKLGEMGLPYGVDGIDLSADGRTLAVGACAMHVFDVAIANGRVIFTSRFSALDQELRGGSPIFQEQFRRVAISPDGESIAGAAGTPGPMARDAGHVALFARRDGRRVARLQAPRPAGREAQLGEHDIVAVAFSPDSKLLASGGNERIVELWLAPTTK
jgi:WD40 repeat protein